MNLIWILLLSYSKFKNYQNKTFNPQQTKNFNLDILSKYHFDFFFPFLYFDLLRKKVLTTAKANDFFDHRVFSINHALYSQHFKQNAFDPRHVDSVDVMLREVMQRCVVVVSCVGEGLVYS